jgi:hypothetical protein
LIFAGLNLFPTSFEHDAAKINTAAIIRIKLLLILKTFIYIFLIAVNAGFLSSTLFMPTKKWKF